VRPLDRASRVKLLLLDVDGVLTKGEIIYNDRGEQIKIFDVKDGHGIKLLLRSGIKVMFLSGRKSKILHYRAEDLGVQEIYEGALNKLEVYEKILKKEGLVDEEVCYVGDDLPDIPVLKRVGFAIAVADSTEEVKDVVHYVTSNQGGRGAVREVCEFILKAQGKWKQIKERYLIDG